MSEKKVREELVSRLTSCQSALFAYILALVPRVDAAQDILQDTNVVIWRKLDDGTEVHNFIAWAREVARYKVLAYLEMLHVQVSISPGVMHRDIHHH